VWKEAVTLLLGLSPWKLLEKLKKKRKKENSMTLVE
jgi:hypothetical protein